MPDFVFTIVDLTLEISSATLMNCLSISYFNEFISPVFFDLNASRSLLDFFYLLYVLLN